jgi:hypothetical protein
VLDRGYADFPDFHFPESSEGHLQALTNSICWVPFRVSTSRNLGSECV